MRFPLARSGLSHDQLRRTLDSDERKHDQLSHDSNRAIEHAAKLDCLDCFTIGFTNSKQLDEVVTKLPPLSVS